VLRAVTSTASQWTDSFHPLDPTYTRRPSTRVADTGSAWVASELRNAVDNKATEKTRHAQHCPHYCKQTYASVNLCYWAVSLSLRSPRSLSIREREREHDPFFLAVSVMLLSQTGAWSKGKRKRGRKKFSSNKKRNKNIIWKKDTKKQKTNSVVFSPQANYTDWATATCGRNLVTTFVYRGVSRGQLHWTDSPRGSNLQSARFVGTSINHC
jgi:hypothetical protein